MRFTAIIERDKDGIYVGQIEEVPAAISQGGSLEELKENLQDALELIFSVNREEVEANHKGKVFFTERITIPWWSDKRFWSTLIFTGVFYFEKESDIPSIGIQLLKNKQ